MAETKWATVTKTNGATISEMMVNRLQAANIPAFALQESVGIPKSIIKVPVQFLEEARRLLDLDMPTDEKSL